MKTNWMGTCLIGAILGLACLRGFAQGKESLAVGVVQTNQALVSDMLRQGKALQLQRVVGSLDHQLLSALVQTRKFTVVGRSDLKQILSEQELSASGLVDPNTAAEQGKLRGAKYKLVATVDSFLDQTTQATFADGSKASKRRIQLSAQSMIYDTTTGEAVESSNFQVEKVEASDQPNGQVSDADASDALLPAITREMAEKIAHRTVEVLLPAKIVDKEDKTVTINRGDSFGVKVGEIWTVYGPTKTVTDPDSGEVIRHKGALQGRIKITSVDPTSSEGQIMEDSGINVGSVVSKPQ